MPVDPDTKDCIRTPADEAAVIAGMRMDLSRANFAVEWIESHCCLYEGDKAGEPLILLPAWRTFVQQAFGWVCWSSEKGQWVRRFRHAAFWAGKKNGKSPTLAAIELLMLCGDGEPGQKCYTAAKNGDQAKITQRHAVEMVRQSPALIAECKIAQNTLQIDHLPSKSIMMILTGDDSRGQKAKEGLNGSVFVDECHVVDRAMMERITRAGISRKEPLFLSVSTAGDDPSSYGFERCQYGRQVNSGQRADLRFLHVEYAAPEGTTESQVAADLDRYGKMANPAWGVIVQPSEFREDFERSRGNSREMARFLQYRGNMWVGSTNRWLDAMAWANANDGFALDDLAGRDCYAAIDLSRTRDMTAVALAFPWPEAGDEAVRVWAEFWLPEDRAKRLSHLYPFLDWARAGHLHLTPGGVVDYARVKKRVREIARSVNLLGLYYDPHYAEEITQQLADGEADEAGRTVAEGIGCERLLFPQTLMHFTGPAKELERRVTAELVRHSGNPVLTWQVGHAEVYADANQNIRPVKPDPNTGKAVDGVVAMTMTMHGITAGADAAPRVWGDEVDGDTREPVPAAAGDAPRIWGASDDGDD